MKRLFSKSNKYSSEWDVELNNISKTNNKRHKIITVSLIVILLMLSGGISFAVWNYGFLGETNKIETGDIEIEFLESNTDIISIENALPMGDNQGKAQDTTFDFQVRTKTKNDTDIGYSLILERVQTLCGDLDNPNKDDYPECYNTVISDTDKDKLISYIVTLNIGGGKSISYAAPAPSSNLTTEQATELYNYIIAHDKEGIYNFYISMGAWEEDAQYIANMFEAEGYELYLIELYQNNTGETITPTYEFKREENIVEKNLCSDLENPNRDDYPECYNAIISDTDKDKLISFLADTFGATTEQATELYNAIIAHDKEGIYNFAISMGASEEDAQSFATMFESNGYELYLIEGYQQNTGETITPTYEFDNTKTYGNIEQLKDKDVKIYLEDYQGNILLEPTKVSEISSDYVIYTKINSHDSNNENIKDKYKLRVWIDGEVDSSDWNATEKHQYKFKIGVKTKLKENEVSTEENPETSDLKYTIKYNANGGKGTMENSTFVYNQTGKLSKNTFAREHYTFKGWSTKSTSNQVVYNDEAEVKNLTDVYHGVVNLYAVWEPEIYTVNVVVQNGTVDTGAKSIEHGQNGTFNLTSDLSDSIPIVTCTNNQTGQLENNILTVSNVTNNTTCTVKYITEMTTLYTDGTLIINELAVNRSSNITNHGAVTNEYDALSSSNSYVFSSDTSMPWNSETPSVTSVEIGSEIQPVSTQYWAYGLTKMTTGDFTKLDTSSVTSMSSMFQKAGRHASTFNLTGLNNWNTSSVTSMYEMFYEAGSSATTWSIGDLSGWNTSSVTDMYGMFYWAGYSSTTFDIGDLSGWDTSSVTNMSNMFQQAGENATTWSIGDLSGWNTSSVTGMSSMFSSAGYSAATFNIGDLSNWDTSSVTNMSSMFSGAGRNVTTFNIGDLSGWNTSSLTNMVWMFCNAGNSATTFNIGDLSSWDTSSVTNMYRMFYYAGYNATTFNIGDLSNWETSSVINMSDMFAAAGYKATTFNIGDLSGWDTSSVTNMSYMFAAAGNSATWSLNCSSWNVNNVTSYTNFNGGVESKVTPPTWVN